MRNLRISGSTTSPRSENDIRLNYWDPSKIIAASNDINNPTQAQFYSVDGGSTWNKTSLPSVPGDVNQSDPEVDWTSDGTAWSATLGITSTSVLRVCTFTSLDNGATWTVEANPSGGQTGADREIMWVDHSPTSPFKDQVYLMWHNGTPVFFARRTAGIGGTWQAPIQLSGAETTVLGIGGDIKTNGFGDVFVFWPDADGSRNILVTSSTDGGVNFGAPLTIAQTFATTRRLSIPADSNRRARVYISAGAYRTATKDLVYAVWSDLSGESGCTTGGGPGTNVNSTCKTRVWFSRSTDGGANWSTPVMLNNQSSLNDQFHSRLCVDESYGNLIVTYHDTADDINRLQSDVWMQTSTDDGQTWSNAVKVTTAQTNETIIPPADPFQYGDYDGLHGFNGTFFPSWTDRRSGGPEEIWTAKIQIPILITQIIAHVETGDKDLNNNSRVYLGFEGKHGREFRMRTTNDPNPFRENTALDIVFGSGANVRQASINDPRNPPMDLTQITGAYIRIEPRQEEPWKVLNAQVFINGSVTPAFSLRLPNIILEEDSGEKVSLG